MINSMKCLFHLFNSDLNVTLEYYERIIGSKLIRLLIHIFKANSFIEITKKH